MREDSHTLHKTGKSCRIYILMSRLYLYSYTVKPKEWHLIKYIPHIPSAWSYNMVCDMFSFTQVLSQSFLSGDLQWRSARSSWQRPNAEIGGELMVEREWKKKSLRWAADTEAQFNLSTVASYHISDCNARWVEAVLWSQASYSVSALLANSRKTKEAVCTVSWETMSKSMH